MDVRLSNTLLTCNPITHMEMQTYIYREKYNANKKQMQMEKLESKTGPNPSSDTMLDHQQSQKLTMLRNTPHNLYQVMQQTSCPCSHAT